MSSLLKAYGAGLGAKAKAMLSTIDNTIKTLMMRNTVRRQSRRGRPLFVFATNRLSKLDCA
jgi:hypothetical protein